MATTAIDIMGRLREETAADHKAAESNPLEQALFRGGLPLEGFVRYLEQRCLVHESLDAAVARLVETEPRLRGLVPAELLQTPNLRADLEHFARKSSEILPTPGTAKYLKLLNTWSTGVNSTIWGAYYVFEGSKNGARILARTIGGAYGLHDGRGLRYLDPHGAAQRQLWQDFRARMNAIEWSATEADAIVDAARATFRAVGEIDMEIWTSIAPK
jgi:heme oxygenase